jgi:Protein of unknown function (DUF1203)
MLVTHLASVPRRWSRGLSSSACPVRFPLVQPRERNDNGAMTNTTFAVIGIDPVAADTLRAAGGIAYVADSTPGYPCRQCLRDAEIGDELLLVSYDPFDATSPYRCASPIFIHTTACTPDDSSDLPIQLTRRQLSVRGFDTEAMMLDAALIDGSDLEKTIEHLLDNPAIDHLHVHNAGRGCWAAKVERASNSSTGGHARPRRVL